jgi:hypothetical protein
MISVLKAATCQQFRMYMTHSRHRFGLLCPALQPE